MRKIFHEETATQYLRRQYQVGNYLNSGFGAISKNKDVFLKKELMQKENFENLGSIHSGVEAKYEFMKQLGLIITVITFLITTLFGVFTFYMQQSLKNIDWTHETIMLDLKANSDLLATREWLKEPTDLYNAKRKLYKQNLLDQMSSYNKELVRIYNAHIMVVSLIILFFILLFSLVWLKYLWLSSIHFCVKEAYKQSEKLHDQRLTLRKERLSLMK